MTKYILVLTLLSVSCNCTSEQRKQTLACDKEATILIIPELELAISKGDKKEIAKLAGKYTVEIIACGIKSLTEESGSNSGSNPNSKVDASVMLDDADSI